CSRSAGPRSSPRHPTPRPCSCRSISRRSSPTHRLPVPAPARAAAPATDAPHVREPLLTNGSRNTCASTRAQLLRWRSMSRRGEPPRHANLSHAETQRLPLTREQRRPTAIGTPADHLERIASLERENAELRAELARLVERARETRND